MTSPPLTPPNRRRRRIVVLAIAVLVLGVGWWFWPRVDQRIVGSWEYVLPPGVFEDEHYVTTYKSDGRFRVKCSDFPDDVIAAGDSSGIWWIDDGHLIEYTPLSDSYLERLVDYVRVRVLHREPRQFAGPLTFRKKVILDVSASSFRICDSFGLQATYRRVSVK